jgi:hypothetical protein
MAGQPQYPGVFEFDIPNYQIQEVGGIAPGVVVNAPNPFNLTLTFQWAGVLAALLAGQAFNITLHTERLEDGARGTIVRGPFAMPVTAPASGTYQLPITPSYTTANVGVADFVVAPGFASGTFDITCHIHFLNAAVRPIVAAFCQAYLEVV